MVFGNMGETPPPVSAFTRNPSTGARELYGEFLVNAQGEDVVAGIRTPQNITEKARIEAGMDAPSLESLMPDTFAELIAIFDRLEEALPRHAGPGIHHPGGQALDAADPLRQAHRAGALKIAVDMAEEGLITKAEAVSRIDPASLDQLAAPHARPVWRARHHRHRPAGLAGGGVRPDRVRQRRGRRSPRARPRRLSWCGWKPRRKTFTACMPPKAS
jgi:pyruvate,orthophosphate dikinase